MSRNILLNILLISFIILLAPALLSAEPISVSTPSSEIMITGNQAAELTFNIENLLNIKQTVSIELASKGWEVEFSKEQLFLLENETQQISAILSPGEDLLYGTHDVTFRFIAKDEAVERTIRINRIDPSTRDPIHLSSDSSVPSKIDPNYPIEINLIAVNQESFDKKDITVRVSAGNFLEGSSTFDLAAYERKEVPLKIEIASSTKPQKTMLKVFFIQRNTIVSEFSREIEIIPVELELQDRFEEKKGFLKRESVYKIHNPSNVAREGIFNAEISFFPRIFSKTIPEAEYDSESNSYLWQLSLDGDEVTELIVSTNYRIFFYIILILFALIIAFHIIKPDIFLSKSFTKIKYYEDGTFSGARVMIHLKNKTRETLRNVKVIEMLPEITHYEHKSVEGSIEPSSVRKLDHTMKVLWTIDELSPSEERIVVYHIRSRLGVVGVITLPAAKITFDKVGKKQVVYSNTLTLPAKDNKYDY